MIVTIFQIVLFVTDHDWYVVVFRPPVDIMEYIREIKGSARGDKAITCFLIC